MEQGAGNAADARFKLEHHAKLGANWFFWIAGLSVVNSLIAMFSPTGGGFVFGLGITRVIDAIGYGLSEELGSAAKIAAFVLSLIPVGVFVVIGVFARKKYLWAFIVGMALYAIDGLLFLLVKDWLSIGFHVFAIFCVLGGLKACIKLNAMLTREESTAEAVAQGGLEQAGASEDADY